MLKQQTLVLKFTLFKGDLVLKCLYCEATLEISKAEYNALNYDGIFKISTPCCGNPISVKREITLIYNKIDTDEKEDDWGTPYNIVKLNQFN